MSVKLLSTVLMRTPPEPMSAQFRLAWALHAPKLFSDRTFFDATPRILCAAQRKGPFRYHSATDVGCRFRMQP